MSSIRNILIIALVLVCLGTIALVTVVADTQEFICGDVNGDTEGPNVSDVTYLVGYLFQGFPPPPDPAAVDLDGQPGINVADLTYLVSFLFTGGPPPGCTQWSHTELFGDCFGGDMEPPGEPTAPFSLSSDCLEMGRAANDSTEYMWAELIGDDLHIHHINAYYQCCLEYAVTFEVDGYAITAFEADTGELCDCYCYFDLEAVLPDLLISTPCEYVVTLIGIEGDTVGVDTLIISDSSYMYIDVIGNDIHIHHMSAFTYCCPEFYVDYQFDGYNITVTEFDSTDGCYCYCYYNLRSTIYDLSDGEWTVTLIGICPNVLGGPCDTVGVETVVVGEPGL